MPKKIKFTKAKLIVNPGAGDASEVASRVELVVRYFQDEGIEIDVAFAAPKKEAFNIAKKALKMGTRLSLPWAETARSEKSFEELQGPKQIWESSLAGL